MNVDNVLDWLSNVIRTTPDGIIQSLIVSIVMLVLRKTLPKLPRIGSRFSGWINKLSHFFNNNSFQLLHIFQERIFNLKERKLSLLNITKI